MSGTSRAIVVTGMHRSGTSVLAHALSAAGVAMGDRLNPAGAGNHHGHFEDLDFLRFHEDFLRARAIDALTPPAAWTPDPTAAETARAERLRAARDGRALWGFKDPRASLFLSFWRERLPNAGFVLMYRHPVEVVLSLLRRGSDPEVLRSPRTAFAAWRVYNQRLLELHAAHPDACLLLEARAAAGQLGGCLALVGARFGATLHVESARDIFDADSLRSGLELPDERWRELVAIELDLYAALQRAADLPAPSLAATPSRDGALAERLLWSQVANADRGAADGASLVPEARQAAHVWRAADHVARLEAQAAQWRSVEATRGWRLLTRYWHARTALRKLVGRPRRELAEEARAPHADPARVVVVSVLDESPRRFAHAVRMAQSLRWFGGALAEAPVVIWSTDEPPQRLRQRLSALGVEVRALASGSPGGAFSHRLQALSTTGESAGQALLLLGRDAVVVRDPAPFLARDAVRIRPADLPALPSATLRRASQELGVPLPRPGDPTTLRLEARGVWSVPARRAAELATHWRRCHEVLAERERGLDAGLTEALSLSLALSHLGLAVELAPPAFGFALGRAESSGRRSLEACDPAILLAGDREQPDGSLAATAHRATQRRIEMFNARWWAAATPSSPIASHAAVGPSPVS